MSAADKSLGEARPCFASSSSRRLSGKSPFVASPDSSLAAVSASIAKCIPLDLVVLPIKLGKICDFGFAPKNPNSNWLNFVACADKSINSDYSNDPGQFCLLYTSDAADE